ncbi:zinc ribbon domain-containing protein [Streptomyces sp. NPDC093982]|uniref:zinc ribbon domain-containing protein n=1 Tax=Streptomyces sp. NPDC093982 TaxID=3155077 RepID=UPI003422A470
MGRVSDRRADLCAQTAATLTAKNALVVLEDLKTRRMTASASGTLAEPSRVAQKQNLNRAILNKGWHRLEHALTSVARYTGTRVVTVHPAYTSQRCAARGFVTETNRESRAPFRCKATDCGHTAHAAINAAININHTAGHAASACRDLGNSRPVKQEPEDRATGPFIRQSPPSERGGSQHSSPLQPRARRAAHAVQERRDGRDGLDGRTATITSR